MKFGYLSEYFDGVAAKRLSAVETDMLVSNQHEFQGVKRLTELLGEPVGKVPFSSRVLYLTDEISEPLLEDVLFTWYDVRAGERARGGTKTGRLRWEYRLYFPTTCAADRARPGDLLVIAKRREGGLLVIVAENGSSIARQVEGLFGIAGSSQLDFLVKPNLQEADERLGFTSRRILESIGVVVEQNAPDYLSQLQNKFGNKFPATREFSEHARTTLPHLDPIKEPDAVLMAWMEREELLFRTFERALISARLEEGFGQGSQGEADVDGFLQFSLSVQNRRKSRVGLALENHLECLFDRHGLAFTRAGVTENRSKPDFLFPGAAEYSNPEFDAKQLLMLGVKSTCKDRWRQVLAEADRISEKHLLTLEASISQQQTDEMTSKNLRLVVPHELHSSYSSAQRERLMTVSEFISLARARREAAE
jgi:hypothetical protein